MIFNQNCRNESGTVLVTGLMFLALLSILGTSAYLISTTDVKISANYKYSEEAFNQAEAGVQYGIGIVQKGLEADTFLLPIIGSPVTISSTYPTGFNFSLTNLEKTGTNAYKFTSTGTGPQGARAEIDAVFKMASAISLAIQGDEDVTLHQGKVNSYCSSSTPRPDIAGSGWNDSLHSTHHADVGCNGDGSSSGQDDFSFTNNPNIDGYIIKGEKSGLDPEEPKSGTYIGIKDQDEIDDDPLDIANDPDFVNDFAAYDPSAGGTNENTTLINKTATGVPYDPGAEIEAGDGDITLNGKSGGSDFYFDQITLSNSGNQVLTIDAQNGPVNIWIKGQLTTQNGGSINIINTSDTNKVTINVTEGSSPANIIQLQCSSGVFNADGKPSHVLIRTDSTKTVHLHNSQYTKAIVYAPFGHIKGDNNAKFYGAVVGNTIDMQDITFYYDEDIENDLTTDDVSLTSWKQELY